MSLDILSQQYLDFLKENGVADPDEAEIRRRCTEKIHVPDHIGKALLSGDLSGLTEEDVVSLYTHMGVSNFIKDLRLTASMAQFMAMMTFLPPNVRSVIDFDCKVGLRPVFFAKGLGWQAAGVDPCKPLLEHGQGLCQKYGVNVGLLHKFSHTTGLGAGMYDLATAVDAIDYYQNWRKVVAEMARVAKNVIIIYSLISKYRCIDPQDVLRELANTMMSTVSMGLFNPFFSKENPYYVVISASRETASSNLQN